MTKNVSHAAFTVLLLTLLCAAASAQGGATPRLVELAPFDRAVPGQILEARVEGLGERFTSPPEGGELKVRVTQDGVTKTSAARTATPVIIREAREGGDGFEMKAYQNVTFVVPRGLHLGEAEVSVVYRGRASAPLKLNVVDRPPAPALGGAAVITVAPASLPAPPRKGTPVTASLLGLKFERGARAVELHVRPLVDPADPDAAVLVRFRQGGAYYDAEARVVHQERRTENVGGGVRFLPARDTLQVDVPALLMPGEAQMEVRLRAAGQTGEAAVAPVTITDAERAFESPKEAAPRLLAVTPRRVGAGQAVMISVDRRRSLDPDPSKAQVVVEGQDGTSYTVVPEMNSAVHRPDTEPDAPVMLIARLTSRVTGEAQLRVVNPARDDYAGASSEPATVEVVGEVLPPRVAGAAESTAEELAPLRQMYEAQRRAGRTFNEYDPSARYITIRVTGLDYNPRFLRVTMEQEGRPPATLSPADFSLYTGSMLIVRVPRGFSAGPVRIQVENRGEGGYSAPASATFEISARPDGP